MGYQLGTAGKLTCDMTRDCAATVTHLDKKGYVYCETHGVQRRAYIATRKLRVGEIKKLEQGQPIGRY